MRHILLGLGLCMFLAMTVFFLWQEYPVHLLGYFHTHCCSLSH